MTSRVALPADPIGVPDRSLPAGTGLDSYVVETVIARSDFAVVYRACDRRSSEVVAIKEYLPHVLARRSAKGRLAPRSRAVAARFEQGRAAFVDEARRLARFEHGSLLRVRRVFETGGTVFRVMPFSPGPTLLEYRRALGQMPAPDDLARWAEGLLGALAVLHANGCVHGAVWPGNIVLRPGERALLLDFDAVREALFSHQVPGTMPAPKVGFMPPECHARTAGVPLGPWTDLYGLAASLHYGICGELPAAPAAGTAATAFGSLTDHWHRMCGTRPMPAEIARLFSALEACLAEAPEQRPQSVAAFRERWLGSHMADAVDLADAADVADAGPASRPEVGAEPAAIDRATEPGAVTPVLPADGGPAIAIAVAAPQAPSVDQRPLAARGVRGRHLAGAAAAGALGMWLIVGPWWAGGPDPVVQAAAPPLPSATEVIVAAPAPASSPAAEVGLREPPAGPERATADPVAATATATATEATQAGAGRGPAPERASRATPLAADDVPVASAAAAVAGRVVAAPARPVDNRRPRADAVAAAATSPAQTCAGRTGFALYQCMQLACAKSASPDHAACAELRRSDAVD